MGVEIKDEIIVVEIVELVSAVVFDDDEDVDSFVVEEVVELAGSLVVVDEDVDSFVVEEVVELVGSVVVDEDVVVDEKSALRIHYKKFKYFKKLALNFV